MTDQQLKKLKRVDLLELLTVQAKEIEQLRAQIEGLQEQLTSRKLALEEAGSIAEASLRLNEVFRAAQAAADQYVENVTARAAQQEALLDQREEESRRACEKREEESRRTCEKQEEESRRTCEKQEEESRRTCEKLIADAKKEADAYWADIQRQANELLSAHEGLAHLLKDHH